MKETLISLKWLLQDINRKSYLSLALFIVLGFFQGVGIVLIVPLLSITGFQVGAGINESMLTQNAKTVFQYLHIPLTFESVLLLFIGIILIYSIAKYYSTLLNAELSQGYSNQLRKRLHHAILETEWSSIVKMRSSDMVGLMSREVSQVAHGITLIIQLIGTTVLLLVNITTAFFISASVTCFVLGGAAILAILQRGLFSKAVNSGKRNLKHSQSLQTNLHELFEHIKPAKSQNLNEQQKLSLEKISDAMYSTQHQYTQTKAKSDFIYDIGAAILVATFIYVVFTLFSQPALDLVLLIYVFSRILPGFRSAATNIQNILHIMPVVTDIKEKINLFENKKEKALIKASITIAIKQGIELQNVSFCYIADKPILTNAYMHIPANKITSITGASGAGKSTLADILTGLLQPSSGQILIDDRPLEYYGINNWRSGIAYMPQENFLFHDSIRNNLLWAKPDATEMELWQALEQANAKKYILNLDKSIDTIVGDRGIRLSGGQKQRIALAMALIRKPVFLILDEATNELDEYTESEIYQTIEQLKQSMTVLIITHRLSSMKMADNALILKDGKFVAWQSTATI